MLIYVIKKLNLVVLSLLSLWISGFLLFVNLLPTKPEDTTTLTDAIVVWTGGPCRVTTGFELLNHGLSDKLLISGVAPDTTNKQKIITRLCRTTIHRDRLETLLDKTTLGFSAKTTVGNAVETAEWALANNIKSIRLVTSAMHIPRCWIEFHRYLPNCTIIFHPVDIERFDHRQWWHNIDVFIKVAREYTKFIIVVFGGPSERPEMLEVSKLEESKEGL